MPSSVALLSLQKTQAPVSLTITLLPSTSISSQSPPSRRRFGRISSITALMICVRSVSGVADCLGCSDWPSILFTFSSCLFALMDCTRPSAEPMAQPRKVARRCSARAGSVATASAERLSAGAARLCVRILEREPRSFEGNHEIYGGARQELVAFHVDEHLHAIAFDHSVVGLGVADETHHVLVAGAAAGLDHDAQAADGVGRPGDRAPDRVQRAVGEIDHCCPSLLRNGPAEEWQDLCHAITY